MVSGTAPGARSPARRHRAAARVPAWVPLSGAPPASRLVPHRTPSGHLPPRARKKAAGLGPAAVPCSPRGGFRGPGPSGAGHSCLAPPSRSCRSGTLVFAGESTIPRRRPSRKATLRFNTSSPLALDPAPWHSASSRSRGGAQWHIPASMHVSVGRYQYRYPAPPEPRSRPPASDQQSRVDRETAHRDEKTIRSHARGPGGCRFKHPPRCSDGLRERGRAPSPRAPSRSAEIHSRLPALRAPLGARAPGLGLPERRARLSIRATT